MIVTRVWHVERLVVPEMCEAPELGAPGCHADPPHVGASRCEILFR